MRSARQFVQAITDRAGMLTDDDVIAMITDRDDEIRATTLRDAARAVDGMVVGGRAWNARQEAAANILGSVAKGLREFADRVANCSGAAGLCACRCSGGMCLCGHGYCGLRKAAP